MNEHTPDLLDAHQQAPNNSIRALQLQPSGVIRSVYPLNGNENAIGLNLFTCRFMASFVTWMIPATDKLCVLQASVPINGPSRTPLQRPATRKAR